MWADFCDVYSPNVEKNNIIEEIQTNANIAYYAMEKLGEKYIEKVEDYEIDDIIRCLENIKELKNKLKGN
jgi:hypothetical protein|nr:MAG TPA: hypothetical protein [Caudoviricetes sp.]